MDRQFLCAMWLGAVELDKAGSVPGDFWKSPKAHFNQLQSSSVQNFAGPFQH